MVYKLFDKKSTGSGIKSTSYHQLANEGRKSIVRKIKRKKFYS